MNLNEKIKIYLDQIRSIKGVENAVLTQRDGQPIQSTGVWFSKDEIFDVSTASCAIYNVSIHMHPSDLNYILIEGKKAKILIAPLNNPIHTILNKILEVQDNLDNIPEFFIAITAQPSVNLGGIFLQTSECLKNIKTSLIASGETFKPPLIQFDGKKIENIIKGFNVKEDEDIKMKISPFSIKLSENVATELRKVLENLSMTIPDLNFAFITIQGGYVASKTVRKSLIAKNNLDKISAMTDSIFQTANRCSWLLKKMNTENVLIDCNNSFQFINRLEKGTFIIDVGKASQKLGLLRLIIPKFSNQINNLIRSAFDLKFALKPAEIKSLLKNVIKTPSLQ